MTFAVSGEVLDDPVVLQVERVLLTGGLEFILWIGEVGVLAIGGRREKVIGETKGRLCLGTLNFRLRERQQRPESEREVGNVACLRK